MRIKDENKAYPVCNKHVSVLLNFNSGL